MIMKRLFYLFFLCSLFFACESDDAEGGLNGHVKTISVTSEGDGFLKPTQKQLYTFSYDQQGRVKKVNDREYTYDKAGKVVSSRIARQEKETRGTAMGSTTFIYAYEEQLNYHWDELGRLQRITIDSLVQRGSTVQNGEKLSSYENKRSHEVLARYTYEGSSLLPAKITYRTLDMNWGNPDQTLGPVEERSFHYAGNLVVEVDQLLTLPNLLPSGLPSYVDKKLFFSFYQYSDQAHYLYEIYSQMGFNPLDYGDVIPANLYRARYVHAEASDFEGAVQADWSKAGKSSLSYDANRLIIDFSDASGLIKERTEVMYE